MERDRHYQTKIQYQVATMGNFVPFCEGRGRIRPDPLSNLINETLSDQKVLREQWENATVLFENFREKKSAFITIFQFREEGSFPSRLHWPFQCVSRYCHAR